jgi:hypothetical protein
VDGTRSASILGTWWRAGVVLAVGLLVGSRLAERPNLAFAALAVSAMLLGCAALAIAERSHDRGRTSATDPWRR